MESMFTTVDQDRGKQTNILAGTKRARAEVNTHPCSTLYSVYYSRIRCLQWFSVHYGFDMEVFVLE